MTLALSLIVIINSIHTKHLQFCRSNNLHERTVQYILARFLLPRTHTITAHTYARKILIILLTRFSPLTVRLSSRQEATYRFGSTIKKQKDTSKIKKEHIENTDYVS